MRVKKSLTAVALCMSMMVVSAVPAFAAGNLVTSGENVDYTANTDIEGDFENPVNRDTEVRAVQASSFVVTVPAIITLNGKKGEANDADYTVTVTGDIDGGSTVKVVPVTTHTGKDKVEVADNFNDTATLAGEIAAHSGTFAMCETGIKADITATIVQEDTDWTIATDGVEVDGVQSLDAQHAGNVSVAGLSSGIWEQTITYSISVK